MMFDVLIIGAGIVGVSIARALTFKIPSLRIAVLEKEKNVASHTSGRNSGVVHSGFNSKPGTLKARFCVEGNQRIRELSSKKNIPFQTIGTIVVATVPAEIATLEHLLERGTSNGVPSMRLLDTKELKNMEPYTHGIAALYAPTGGTVDSRKFVQMLAEESQERGVSFFFEKHVRSIEKLSHYYLIDTGDERYQAQYIINCAGLYADIFAHMMDVGWNYSIIPFRGEYYYIRSDRSYLVRTMIYPIPHPIHPFLGIHFTRTVHGDIIVGPNAVLALGREAYSVKEINAVETMAILSDVNFWKLLFKSEFFTIAIKQALTSLSKKAFLKQARRLIPTLQESDLIKGQAGNRAQLVDNNGNLVDDLVIEKKGSSIHILNVVSPGFTCALPFADYIVDQFLI